MRAVALCKTEKLMSVYRQRAEFDHSSVKAIICQTANLQNVQLTLTILFTLRVCVIFLSILLLLFFGCCSCHCEAGLYMGLRVL